MLLLTLRKVSSILLVCCLQIANAGEIIGSITGIDNILNITQTGNAAHYADINLDGDGHEVSVTQSGSTAHYAEGNFANSGGAWNFILNQSETGGSTWTGGGTCYVAAGCSATVIQND
jgi:hypothetical protein